MVALLFVSLCLGLVRLLGRQKLEMLMLLGLVRHVFLCRMGKQILEVCLFDVELFLARLFFYVSFCS